MVPLAGIEPALLAESDFESDASTCSAIGAEGVLNDCELARQAICGQLPKPNPAIARIPRPRAEFRAVCRDERRMLEPAHSASGQGVAATVTGQRIHRPASIDGRLPSPNRRSDPGHRGNGWEAGVHFGLGGKWPPWNLLEDVVDSDPRSPASERPADRRAEKTHPVQRDVGPCRGGIRRPETQKRKME